MSKRSILGIIPAALLVLGAGCRPAADKPTERPAAAPQEVLVVAPAELHLDKEWALAIGEWESATGGTASVQSVEFAESGDESAHDADAVANAGLIVAPLANGPQFISHRRLASVPDDAAAGAAAFEELFHGLRMGLATPEGRPGLLPIDCPVLACYYRADLLQAAGRAPPQSWTEYQQLVDEIGEWAPGKTAVEPWSPEFAATMFLARSASYAMHPDNLSLLIDLETGRPLLDEPPFVRALTESAAAVAAMPAARTTSPGQAFEELLSGRAALVIAVVGTGGWQPAAEVASADRETGMVIGGSALPGAAEVYYRQESRWEPPGDGAVSRVTLAGFAGTLVAAGRQQAVEKQTAAWSLWAAAESQMRESPPPWLSLAMCGPQRASRIAERPPASLTQAEWGSHVAAVTQSLESARVVWDLPLPQRERFRSILTKQVLAALDGTAAPEEALRQATLEWDALMDEIGRPLVIDTCRMCAGLSPQQAEVRP